MQVSPPPSIPSPPPPPPPLQERKLGHAGWAERKLGQAGWTEVDEHARRARQHILTCCCPGYQVHLERGIERSLEHAAPLPVLRKAQKGEVLSLLSTCLLCPETETQQICSVAHWSVSQGIIVRRCFLVPSGNISCFNFTTSCFVVDMQSYHSLQEVKITHFHILEDFKLKDLLAFSFLDSKNSIHIPFPQEQQMYWCGSFGTPIHSCHCAVMVLRDWEKAVTCACQFSCQTKRNKKQPQAMSTLVSLMILLIGMQMPMRLLFLFASVLSAGRRGRGWAFKNKTKQITKHICCSRRKQNYQLRVMKVPNDYRRSLKIFRINRNLESRLFIPQSCYQKDGCG